jgi:hypothetical protein
MSVQLRKGSAASERSVSLREKYFAERVLRFQIAVSRSAGKKVTHKA